jgi:hypothetical protein
MGQSYTVYALIDPHDQFVRYVEMSKHVQRCYQEHYGGRTSRPLARWHDDLKAQGLLLLLQILEKNIPDEETAWSRERHWTDVFLAAGAPLLNNIDPFVREKYAQ